MPVNNDKTTKLYLEKNTKMSSFASFSNIEQDHARSLSETK